MGPEKKVPALLEIFFSAPLVCPLLTGLLLHPSDAPTLGSALHVVMHGMGIDNISFGECRVNPSPDEASARWGPEKKKTQLSWVFFFLTDL